MTRVRHIHRLSSWAFKGGALSPSLPFRLLLKCLLEIPRTGRQNTTMPISSTVASQPLYQKDEKTLCFHGELLYEAKVMEVRRIDPKDKTSAHEYRVHYKGWKNSYVRLLSCFLPLVRVSLVFRYLPDGSPPRYLLL